MRKNWDDPWELEDYMELGRKHREFMKEWRNVGKTEEEIKREEERKKNPQPPKAPVYNDSTGLIIYILVMLVGTIFYDRVLIWVAATIIYCYYKFVPYNKRK